jgi:hypothetical protein
MNSGFLCNKFEKRFALTLLTLFIIITSGFTLFGFLPIINSTFISAFYVILISGISISYAAITKIGVRNFIGKALFYFFLATLLTLINTLLINFNFHFELNEIIWFLVSLFIVTGLVLMLNLYKLTLPKTATLETGLIFFILLVFISLIAGWPQIINSILITTGIMAIRVSGKKTNCGIVFISVGLIILAISNILFVQRYWSGINFFGDISDLSLLLSWFSIVTGIYFIKRNHA